MEITHSRLVNHEGKLFLWAVGIDAQGDGFYVLECWDWTHLIVNSIYYTEADALEFIDAWCEDSL